LIRHNHQREDVLQMTRRQIGLFFRDCKNADMKKREEHFKDMAQLLGVKLK
jgi:hypothetical protein